MTAKLPELVLVEDRLDDELMSKKGIIESGVACRITVRRDGEEALEYLLGDLFPLPALIVLDYNMPKLTGAETLAKLRSDPRTTRIPVVIFSSSTNREELSECYRIGANSVVIKPMDAQQYMDQLGWITRYWLTLNLTTAQVA